MKTCRTCGTAKPHSEFYSHPNMRDGRLNDCKTCFRAKMLLNRRNNIDRYLAYDRARAMRPDRIEARMEYARTEKGKAVHAASIRSYRTRFPEKSFAHNVLNSALRDGKITRGPCEVCGNPRTQAHHDDYLKPLEVRWLCSRHHADHHRRQRSNP